MSTYAMDLVVATSENIETELQLSLANITKQTWGVTAYKGSDVDMVDDIRLRAVTSTLPDAAQIPGATIRRWAALGFLNNLSDISAEGSWSTRLPVQISKNVSFRDSVYAIPTQVHRSNWMWLNKAAITSQSEGERFDAPRTWKSFFELVELEKSSGVPFLLLVDDPVQNTLILEALILGLKGSEFYQNSFQELDYATLKSQDMIDVFAAFAKLRPLMSTPRYSSWESASEALTQGNGAAMFAGDWIKPYLKGEDGQLLVSVACEPFPEAAATFLYNLNSVVVFKETDAQSTSELARAVFTESMLTELNIREGSIPARLDISPWGFDRCSVRAMREFRSAHTTDTLQPSLAAGMATLEVVQKAVYNAVDSFINDSSMSPEEGARKLAKAVRVAVYKI